MIGLSTDPPGVDVMALTVPAPRLNLLPPEIAEHRRLRQVKVGLGGVVLAAMLIVSLLYLAATSSVRQAETSVQSANATQSRLQAEQATYREVTATYTRAAQAEAMLVQAMGEEVRWSRFLDDLSLTIPKNVWVTNLNSSQGPATAPPAGADFSGIGTVTISGVARNHDDVAAWLETLAAQKGYSKPHLQSSTKALLDGQKVVNWATTVSLTSEALSGRYTRAGS